MWIAAALLAVPSVGLAQESGDPVVPAAAPVPEDVTRAQKVAAADLALQGNRLIEAQALLTQLAQTPGDPDEAKIILMRAELMVATARPDAARALLATLGDRDVPICRVSTAYALADLQDGRLADADGRLQAQAAACSDDVVFWSALGQARLGLARAADAVDAYRHALALRTDSALLRNDLAVALLAAGEAGEANFILADLFTRHPTDMDVAVNLDFAGGMLGRMPQRRDSDDGSFWSRRLQAAGLGARRAGRANMAEALFAQALLARPRHDAELWRQYSEVAGVK